MNELIILAIAGIENAADRSFAEVLYFGHRDKVYKTAYRILKNVQDAEDITADVFMKIIDRIKEYHGKSDNELASIFVTIAKNLAINKYKRNSRIEFLSIEEESDESDSDEVGDFVVKKELHERLYKAVDSLDEEYSRVVKLKMGYEYSDKKIAEILNISDGNVRIKYHRAKKLLLEYLEGSI
jgi:RNA polymerase sigma-70 factor (ECF subfamily)